MKILLRPFIPLVLLLILGPAKLLADPWDALTSEEASRVVEYIEANPFLVDYCDPCDDPTDAERSPAYLIMAKNPRVVPCHWDTEKWSVQVDWEVLVWGFVGENKAMEPEEPISALRKGMGPSPIFLDDDRYCLTMNYHWTLVEGEPVRLCFPVDYSYSMPNGGFAAFPSSRLIEDKKTRKAYQKWLEKA